MITVDTRGKLCPQPLIMAKRAIKSATEGEMISLICDNEVAFLNLQDYLRELNYQFDPVWEGSEGVIQLVTSATAKIDTLAAEEFCHVPKRRGNYVVVLKTQTMGSGDDDLGAILMRAFVNSLEDADQLPSSVILYNGGVYLAQQGQDTVDALLKLEKMGVMVYICGTCVDYFELKDQLAVGCLTNMYKITELLSKASHVIYP